MSELRYRKETDLNWRRIKNGDRFRFVDEKGRHVSSIANDRIEALAIPPAWRNVAISSDPRDHIQAIGTDDAGRKQYIYNPEWIKHNQKHKFDQMIDFGEKLPNLRQVVSGHMREHLLTRDRVLATAVWLLEHTFIRVGNKTYAEENQSYGLTTMREKHIDISGNTMTFSFEGKSGVFHELGITHPRVTQTIRKCIELPGYELFQYLDEGGDRHVIDSMDVNNYLQTYTGADFSAKDFRTWGGSVLAAGSLYRKGDAQSESDFKTNVADVVAAVSNHLGNTEEVCRAYYIHPVIINSYEKNTLVPHFKRSYRRKSPKRFELKHEEYATWSLIKNA